MLIEKHEEQNVAFFLHYWHRYKKWIIGSFLSVIVFLFARHLYQRYEIEYTYAAAEHYQTFLEASDKDDRSSMRRSLDILQNQYPSSSFSLLAGMVMTKNYLKHEQYDEAQQSLYWMIQHAQEEEFKVLAQFKLAELFYHIKSYSKALEHLDALNNPRLKFLVLELKGDIYKELEQYDQALACFKELLKDSTIDEQSRSVLVAKYTYLSTIHR
jgi:predicted negative regulator of RcsB-dependent stress response